MNKQDEYYLLVYIYIKPNFENNIEENLNYLILKK